MRATTALNGYQAVGNPAAAVDFDSNYFGRGLPPRTFGVTATYKF